MTSCPTASQGMVIEWSFLKTKSSDFLHFFPRYVLLTQFAWCKLRLYRGKSQHTCVKIKYGFKPLNPQSMTEKTYRIVRVMTYRIVRVISQWFSVLFVRTLFPCLLSRSVSAYNSTIRLDYSMVRLDAADHSHLYYHQFIFQIGRQGSICEVLQSRM